MATTSSPKFSLSFLETTSTCAFASSRFTRPPRQEKAPVALFAGRHETADLQQGGELLQIVKRHAGKKMMFAMQAAIQIGDKDFREPSRMDRIGDRDRG